jgi:hypothetical protein
MKNLISLVKHTSMQWYNLVLFILVNAGLSVSVTRSKLLEPIRKKIQAKNEWLGYMVTCVMCFGLYSSIPVYIYIYRIIDFNLIVFMFLGSFTAYFMNRISNT